MCGIFVRDDDVQGAFLCGITEDFIGVHDVIKLELMRDELLRLELPAMTVLSSLGVITASTSRVVMVRLSDQSF